jgi:hypothetical protein
MESTTSVVDPRHLGAGKRPSLRAQPSILEPTNATTLIESGPNIRPPPRRRPQSQTAHPRVNSRRRRSRRPRAAVEEAGPPAPSGTDTPRQARTDVAQGRSQPTWQQASSEWTGRKKSAARKCLFGDTGRRVDGDSGTATHKPKPASLLASPSGLPAHPKAPRGSGRRTLQATSDRPRPRTLGCTGPAGGHRPAACCRPAAARILFGPPPTSGLPLAGIHGDAFRPRASSARQLAARPPSSIPEPYQTNKPMGASGDVTWQHRSSATDSSAEQSPEVEGLADKPPAWQHAGGAGARTNGGRARLAVNSAPPRGSNGDATRLLEREKLRRVYRPRGRPDALRRLDPKLGEPHGRLRGATNSQGAARSKPSKPGGTARTERVGRVAPSRRSWFRPAGVDAQSLCRRRGTLDEPHERSQPAAQRLRAMGSGTTARTGMRLLRRGVTESLSPTGPRTALQ